MKTISIDLETYSDVDLQKCGVYKYAQSENFEILLFGYSVDGGEVSVVDIAQGEKIPKEIIKALADESVIKWAFNASFERATSRSIFLPATRSHIIRRMLLTATRSVCSPLFWRKIRMLSVGSSLRLTSLACSGKQVSSIILISSWKQLRENSWSRLRL